MSGVISLNDDAEFGYLNATGAAVEADRSWSPRKKLLCILGTGVGSWVLVLSPFLVWG